MFFLSASYDPFKKVIIRFNNITITAESPAINTVLSVASAPTRCLDEKSYFLKKCWLIRKSKPVIVLVC
uniref:Uncharacterized protein n=1 Tax=Sinocyclocheilus rhinocerous TaxID=307959 RepID=A0A673M1G9_9TELE